MAESIGAIRETSRISLALNRRRRRDEDTDINRYLGNIINSTPEVISDITNKLKTQTAVTATELRTLKNAMINNEQYVQTVLSTHGALRGIVRELSGHSANKQYEAMGCCCALALGGGGGGGMAVARAAAPYLSALLDSLSSDLAVACMTALFSVAGSGAKAYALLTAQGAVPKLLDSIIHPEVMSFAVKPLLYCTLQLKDDLRPEHMDRIFNTLTRIEIHSPDITRLLFSLSCHQHFSLHRLSEGYVEKLLDNMYEFIRIFHYCKESEKLDYLLRFFANVNDEAVYRVILNHFVVNNMCASVRLLLATYFDESVLWLLGNMYTCCGDSEFFKQLLD